MSVRNEVRNEVEADIHDIQHNDLEGGIDNRRFGKFLFAIVIRKMPSNNKKGRKEKW